MSGGDQGPKVALKKILVQEFPKQKQEGREVHPCFRGKTVGQGVAQTNKAAFDEAYKTAGTWRKLAIAVHEWANRTMHAEFPHPGAWEPGMEAGRASPEWAPYAQRITDMVAELAERAKSNQGAKKRKKAAEQERARDEARDEGYQEGFAHAEGLQQSSAQQERAPDVAGPSSAGAPMPATLAPAAGARAPPTPPASAAAHFSPSRAPRRYHQRRRRRLAAREVRGGHTVLRAGLNSPRAARFHAVRARAHPSVASKRR